MPRDTSPPTESDRQTTTRDADPAVGRATERSDSAAASRRSVLRAAGAGAGALALGPSLAAGQSEAPPEPDAPVIVAEDGEAVITWEPVEGAAEYVLQTDEEIHRTSETSVPLAEVWDPTVETAFRVVAVNDAGETSDRSDAAPYFPPGDRQYDLDVWRGGDPITAGERGPIRVYSGWDMGLLDRYEVRFEVQSPEDAARIVDIEPVDVVEEVETDEIPEDGVDALDVTVPFPDAVVRGGTRLLELTVEGTNPGDVTVDASFTAFYGDMDEPVEHAVDPAEFSVEAPEPPSAPATVEPVATDTASVELEWSSVPEAAEYEVYVAEHDVPVVEEDEGLAIDPDADDPAARTSDEQVTIDGLDSLTAYDLGVVAVDDYGGASELATAFATTAPTEEQASLPEISLDLDHSTVVPGEVPRATLSVSGLEAPLGGWTIEVRSDDSAVASVGDVSIDSEFLYSQVLTRAEDDSWATLDAVDADGSTGSAEEVELATIELETDAEGVAAIDVAVEVLTYVDGDTGTGVPDGATVDVAADNWAGEVEYGGETTVPQDLDGDGLYRDLTGDGAVGQDDVASFFGNLNRDVVEQHPSAFDFSGNGEVGHGDVVALFEDVALH